MADANTVIAALSQQIAQLTVDKAILTAELAELRAKYEQTVDLEVVEGDPPAQPAEE
jgi:hypothetical protein